MPEKDPRPTPSQPWENGWAPDTSHIPGTRRLWLAGALALATVAACTTALLVTRTPTDKASPPVPEPKSATTVPGLIFFATDSATPTAKPHAPSARPTTAAPSSGRPTHKASPSAKPSKAPAPKESSAKKPKPEAVHKSVRSVNYPDRYWHVSGGYVRLDPAGSDQARQDATFTLVKGLSDASCYSFATADGAYLRHRSFVLRAEHDDDSSVFRRDATFCPRAAPHSGAVMLESVNYPGRFLRHQNFQLRLDPYQHSGLYLADSAFQLVDGLA
ncbi:AbfB domain-containing protein [Streptomyces sp. S.PNR 29]|uniref:AbfB domain-containing protein n=1 Tax=Streptomyces sp. S.PNR 29 TaxID=2973805 RepID=UPI0025B06D6D|nr:AbfB domain-containing protein [Streptomyces sp. S.PNR 29]MDN0194982.1 AbfB domain-containing protein [Streptomyces sp. S.PNR 29]